MVKFQQIIRVNSTRASSAARRRSWGPASTWTTSPCWRSRARCCPTRRSSTSSGSTACSTALPLPRTASPIVPSRSHPTHRESERRSVNACVRVATRPEGADASACVRVTRQRCSTFPAVARRGRRVETPYLHDNFYRFKSELVNIVDVTVARSRRYEGVDAPRERDRRRRDSSHIPSVRIRACLWLTARANVSVDCKMTTV